MDIPGEIKENVRAVLLSKTDGSGILVSTFPRDYKSIIHKPLMYRDYGYQTLEKFIKDLPDVCRLEYSDQHMAYKLFGIAKPNTFVSSFVKRAEGNEDSDSNRKSSNKGERIKPTSDLNEKWEPSSRGLYSLCFPNRKDGSLNTKEAVARKFAQLGEVVEINIIPSLTFIRYREEAAAKQAVKLYGDELRLRRAEERTSKSSGRDRDRKNVDSAGNSNRVGSDKNSNRTGENKWGRKEPELDDDENWDDDGGVQNSGGYTGYSKTSQGGYTGYSKTSPGGNVGNSVKSYNHEVVPNSDEEYKHCENSREGQNRAGGDFSRRNDDRPRGTRGPRKGAGDGASKSDQQTSPVQVYIGNWPNDANERDLEELISQYQYIGCRVCKSKESAMKKYAFVDMCDIREAQRCINDLNNKSFRNRDLRCGLGRKKGDNQHSHDDSHKGGIEEQFERLAVHKGLPRHDDKKPLLETPSFSYSQKGSPRHDNQESLLDKPTSPYSQKGSSRYDDQKPLLDTPSSPYSQKGSWRHDDNMPLLETPSSPYNHKGSVRRGDRMQNLETQRSPHSQKSLSRHDDRMPHLETPSSPYRQMPPLENFPNEMPPLENVMSPSIPSLERNPRHDDMPDLEEFSPVKHTNGVADSSAFTPVQLSVGNFPYGTSEIELMMLLGPYGAQGITIMNKDTTSRSTYAFVDFGDVSQAVMAMDNLDQTFFKGRKLVVTLTNPAAVFSQQNMNKIPDLTCTVTGNSDRTVAVHDFAQMSPASVSLNSERSQERLYKQKGVNFNFQRLTTTLQDYTKIATKLRAEDQFQCVTGMIMTVMITYVENEKFFWGQVIEDSVNGKNRGLQRLEMMAAQLQEEPKVTPISGLGRCVAKYENEWFRAWCTFEAEKNGQEMGDLIFIDYGNRTFAGKKDMFKCKPQFWTLPPMAKPFKLMDFNPDLGSYLNRLVQVEVVEPSTIMTNSVIKVHAKWT